MLLSGQQMADIINFMPVATFAISLEGRVISWNHAMELLTGVKAEDMLGKGNYEYALPFLYRRKPLLIDQLLKPELDEPQKARYLFYQRINDDTIIAETHYLTLNGKKTYLKLRATKLFNPEGQVVGAIISHRDITKNKELQSNLVKARDNLEIEVKRRTSLLYEANAALKAEIAERKNAEAALAEEKELLSVTLHSIADGVITTDTKGTICSTNQMAEKILGLGLEEIKGKPLGDYFQAVNGKDTLKLGNDPFLMVIGNNRGNAPADFIELLIKGRVTKIVSANAAPIRDKGHGHGTGGYVIILRDITEHRKVKEQLNLSQKLRSIGELAAGIAHEINTPMQYIGDNIAFLQNAINDIISAEKPDLAYLLGEIPKAFQETLEGIEKVGRIVSAMKDFAHPGKMEMKPADINRAVEVTATISRNEWKYAAELEMRLDPGLPLVCCAIDEINQALLNMTVNAAQAIKEAQTGDPLREGKIIITTKVDRDYVNIILSDNGAGIPSLVIEQIYEPFFTTKEVGQGTGQGLSIAYNIIVNKHKGTMRVDSEVGKGTVFTISLPINHNDGF